MSLLLDTHALLWWITDDRRLPRSARRWIQSEDVLVSVVSLWEIEIKRGLGRIEADTKAILDEATQTEGFSILDVRASHITALADLPRLHGDPFDRMLVAQAQREHATFLSRDKGLRQYPIDVVWGRSA